jgi:hypothetical protein
MRFQPNMVDQISVFRLQLDSLVLLYVGVADVASVKFD